MQKTYFQPNQRFYSSEHHAMNAITVSLITQESSQKSNWILDFNRDSKIIIVKTAMELLVMMLLCAWEINTF